MVQSVRHVLYVHPFQKKHTYVTVSVLSVFLHSAKVYQYTWILDPATASDLCYMLEYLNWNKPPKLKIAPPQNALYTQLEGHFP